ncbi:hypothetical protein C8R44DRAFT_163166 [Mycena epipterygia]|nr:hypothetical protein C8R44DRAFT_163166 [Mycena epipterygia]
MVANWAACAHGVGDGRAHLDTARKKEEIWRKKPARVSTMTERITLQTPFPLLPDPPLVTRCPQQVSWPRPRLARTMATMPASDGRPCVKPKLSSAISYTVLLFARGTQEELRSRGRSACDACVSGIIAFTSEGLAPALPFIPLVPFVVLSLHHQRFMHNLNGLEESKNDLNEASPFFFCGDRIKSQLGTHSIPAYPRRAIRSDCLHAD